MNPFFTWLQATRIATTVGGSRYLTAGLSATHLIGFTVIMGSAVVSNLRLVGALFPGRPIPEVAGPAARAIALGLLVSVTTGLLLFAPRASTAADNDIFRVKMLLLASAALFHFTVHRPVAMRAQAAPGTLRLTGALGLALWFGVAVSGCAFILLE